MIKTKFTGFVCSECGVKLQTGINLPVNEHQITVAPCDECHKKKTKMPKAMQEAVDIFKKRTKEWYDDAVEVRASYGEDSDEAEQDVEGFLYEPDDYLELMAFIDEWDAEK